MMPISPFITGEQKVPISSGKRERSKTSGSVVQLFQNWTRAGTGRNLAEGCTTSIRLTKC